uniref:2-isopropylmalate synthase n=1 Tax=Paulinella chromatophora TaxID=39717 RepID=B1X5H2_PAUCH|nr:2-isopropylmalate synthase [Paulinella chromatophora]ACB43191.1 2-isopropylmalate synthase [Paulinella chromatophora]
MAKDPGRILIFDTTLRDGEQSPGASLNPEEKVAIAQQLVLLGVDIIEAGFPFASPGDFNAVQNIAATIGTDSGPVICGLSRASEKDIKICAKAVAPAIRPRIHTFIATSDIHLKYKLRRKRGEVIQIVEDMVAYARSFVNDVEFSCEDACRSDPEFLYEVIETAILAGATTVNIPDTVGYATPGDFGELIAGINLNVPHIDQAIISVHGHNDLGLAVANFLEAIKNGARQLECTVNGIGERAGNASLEELVMAMQVRRTYFNPFLGRDVNSVQPLTKIKTQEIYKTSCLVSNLTGMIIQANKAIVGANAFAHESGIHQDGVLKNRLTYEIVDARTIGLPDCRLSLGKLSGRSAFKVRLKELGYHLNPEELDECFTLFKELADGKRNVTDQDIELIISEHIQQPEEVYKLKLVQVSCGSTLCPTATVTVQKNDNTEITKAAIGTGPIDAVYRTLNEIVGMPNELTEFSVKSVTAGINGKGEVTIRLRHKKIIYSGHSSHADIVVAATQACLNAINRLISTVRLSELESEKNKPLKSDSSETIDKSGKNS